MRTLAALALASLLLWPGARAHAAPPLSEPEIRAFMRTVEYAARARDVERLGATLATDCRIELRTRIGGQERVTLMTREEYLEMLTSGYASLKDLDAYDYQVDDQQVALENDPPAATVVSHVTETIEFGGRRQVTHSEETARVERRGDSLKVVAVSALTTGS
jgi:hypothetical protein